MKEHPKNLRAWPRLLLGGLLACLLSTGTTPGQKPAPRKKKADKAVSGKQESQNKQGPRAPLGPNPNPGTYRTYDEVLALIGPHVITESMIRAPLKIAIEEARGRILSKDPQGRLPQRVIDSLKKDLLTRKAYDFLLADRVTSLNIPTEALENYLKNQVEKIVEKRRIQAGGWPQFVRNLERMGMSVQTFKKEERSRLQRILVRQEEVRKFLKGGELQVTPTELWEYYQEHKKDFVVTPDAKLRILTFGPTKGPGGIELSGLQAARLARKRILAGEDLEKVLQELGGDLQELKVLPKSGVAKALKAYTWDPKVQVLAYSPVRPFTRGRARILQVLERREGKTLPFQDPEVQRRILAKIRERRLRSIQLRQAWEQLNKIQAWPLDLIRR
ncbi:MAG TPA: peptidyl-prolyl cis-trans isomerase [Planctomycetes bacterium]|nr:peptidyl-prolyl cis-trans isomerase [Planctomycetota bacterium]